jgi:hypothetical protein
MPNQDLRRRAFVADSDYLVDKQNEDERDLQEDHPGDEEQAHHMLQAFHAASKITAIVMTYLHHQSHGRR